MFQYGKSWHATPETLKTLDISEQAQCDEAPPTPECVVPPPESNPCYNLYSADRFGAVSIWYNIQGGFWIFWRRAGRFCSSYTLFGSVHKIMNFGKIFFTRMIRLRFYSTMLIRLLFLQCHALVDPQPFAESCEADLCANATDLCATLERYVAACRRAGLCLHDWRNDLCPYPWSVMSQLIAQLRLYFRFKWKVTTVEGYNVTMDNQAVKTKLRFCDHCRMIYRVWLSDW